MMDAYEFLYLVLHVTVVAAIKEEKFLRYKDQSMVAVTPVHTLAISTLFTCNSQCLSRQDCLAVAVTGNSCSLYDSSVTYPNNQLESQEGTAVYSQDIDVISITLDESTSRNLGKANFFPQLAAIRGGRVVKWRVRCAEAGTVTLTMWRTMESVTSIQLIGRHKITVTDDMVDQIVEYQVPKDEEFTVQAGDFVGFHYDDQDNEARVRILKADDRPDLNIEPSYKAHWDPATDVGSVITVSKAVDAWAPVLAVHIDG